MPPKSNVMASEKEGTSGGLLSLIRSVGVMSLTARLVNDPAGKDLLKNVVRRSLAFQKRNSANLRPRLPIGFYLNRLPQEDIRREHGIDAVGVFSGHRSLRSADWYSSTDEERASGGQGKAKANPPSPDAERAPPGRTSRPPRQLPLGPHRAHLAVSRPLDEGRRQRHGCGFVDLAHHPRTGWQSRGLCQPETRASLQHVGMVKHLYVVGGTSPV